MGHFPEQTVSLPEGKSKFRDWKKKLCSVFRVKMLAKKKTHPFLEGPPYDSTRFCPSLGNSWMVDFMENSDLIAGWLRAIPISGNMSSDVICKNPFPMATSGILRMSDMAIWQHQPPAVIVNPKMAATWMLMPKIWYPLVNVYITNWKDPPCSMGKSTISMVIFNSTLLVITRGYIPIISHYINHYKNPIESPFFMVFDPSPICLKRRMWVDFVYISTTSH